MIIATPQEDGLFVLAHGAPELRGRVIEWLRATGLSAEPVDAVLDVLPHTRPGGETTLLALFASTPSARQAQDLIDVGEHGVSVICAVSAPLDRHQVRHLVEIGVHEVIPMTDNPSEALAQLIVSGLHRQRVRRHLARARERALVKRDVAAALAVASSRREIVAAFADGIFAFGALGVACWERSELGARLTLEVGEAVDGPDLRELPAGARHPAVEALSEARTRFSGSLDEAEARFAEWRRPARSLGELEVLPIVRGGDCDEAVLCRFATPLEDDERHAVEQLASHFGDTLRRAELQTALQIERDVLRRLLSVVSHDLRNPLNTIGMAARLLSDLGEAGPVADFAARIERAGQSATRLVQDLLTFVSSATQGISLAAAPVELLATVQAAVEDTNLRVRGGRRVELRSAPGSTRATVDAVRIEQAVGNLLSNAIAYSTPGSVITVDVSHDAHAVYLDIENRGRKLSPHELAEIFQPMKRLSAVGERGSLGLGLYIVDKILEAHGGSVWVEPGEPDGVRFCLQVPREGRASELSLLDHGARPSRPPLEPVLDPELARLASELRAPGLVDTLQVWAAAKRDDPMPHPLALPRARLLPYLPDIAFATVHTDAQGAPVFVWQSTGARLQRRLRSAHSGALSARDAGAQYEAYERCYLTRRPTYDYVRQRGPRGYVFERLILPLARSRDDAPSELMAIVVFRESSEPARADRAP